MYSGTCKEHMTLDRQHQQDKCHHINQDVGIHLDALSRSFRHLQPYVPSTEQHIGILEYKGVPEKLLLTFLVVSRSFIVLSGAESADRACGVFRSSSMP